MQKQIHECIDGRCPVGIDKVKEIGLTPKEKRAIFFYLKQEIKKLAQQLNKGELFKAPNTDHP